MANFESKKIVLHNHSEVTIRSCTGNDAPLHKEFHLAVSSETVFTLQMPSRTLKAEEVKSRWESTLNHPLQLTLGVFFEEKLIGTLIFFPTRIDDHPWTKHIGAFGMMIKKEFWGQGLGQALIEIMKSHAQKVNITRIEANVRTQNIHGIKLYLKTGFKIEGTRKKGAFIENEYHDEYFIACDLTEKPSPTQNRKTLPYSEPKMQTECLFIQPHFNFTPNQCLEFYQSNIEHFKPTHPAFPKDFYTEKFHLNRISNSLKEFSDQTALSLMFTHKENPNKIIGSINFSQIVKGPLKGCILGYGLHKDYEGMGLMQEALKPSIAWVFKHLGLHRIAANHLPHNSRSAKTLQTLGFSKEGYSNKYLFINGKWQDHVLNALHAPPL